VFVVRVLIVSREYPPAVEGGISTRLSAVVPKLLNRGIEIGVVCFGGSSIAGEKVYSLTPSSRILYRQSGEPGSKELGKIINDIRQLDKLASSLSAEYDVVQVEEPIFGPFLSTPVPIVVTVHNTQFGESLALLSVLSELGQTKRLCFSGTAGIFFDSLCLSKARKIIAVSPTVRSELVRRYFIPRDKIAVIPNGINEPDHTSRSESKRRLAVDGRFVCSFAGRLVDHKRVDVMLRALAIFKKEAPSLKCFVCGSGPKSGSLKKLCKDLELEENVEFTGFVSDGELHAILAASDVFVFPSIYEAWGFAIYEACSYGCAPLVSDIPAFTSTLRDGVDSLIFSRNSAQDLAQKLHLLYSDDALRRRIQSKAMATASTFDWEKSIDGLVELYASVTGEKSRARVPVIIRDSH
jgi:glycogen synthase